MWQVVDQSKKSWLVTGSLKLAMQMRDALGRRGTRAIVLRAALR